MITRPVSGLWGGKRAGSFAGRGAGGHPVAEITRVVSGLYGGRLTGSFAGKSSGVSTHPVGILTRPVSGLLGGKRAGSFAGRIEVVVAEEQQRDGTGWETYVAPITRKTLKKYKEEYLELSYFELEEIKAEAESEIRLAQSEIRINQDLGLQDLITRLKLAISIHKIRLQAIAWVEQERLRKAKKLEKSKILDADLVFIVAYLMDEEDDAWITEIL